MMREGQHRSSALRPSARSNSSRCQRGQTTRISQLISCRRLIESRSRCLRGGLLECRVGILIASPTMNPLRMGVCLMRTLVTLSRAYRSEDYRISMRTYFMITNVLNILSILNIGLNIGLVSTDVIERGSSGVKHTDL